MDSNHASLQAATPTSPQVAASDVRREIRRLIDAFVVAQRPPDPLAEAGVACLEAADCISGVLAERRQSGETVADEAFQEALRAVRAATLAIRFALTAEVDRRRSAE
ncbi:O-linked N-acetylglucosamine transferase [Saccharopolyspora phatthalungensis]|uniref:Uncharacterized protein n=1 Tax=Saccharopolyspora phatthalungensis TaxID=664693 RepID=A0A840QEL2_9PSEU|nr:O-linked N-acetylglucosamine transferase [Saccharopolyspora phatthalungensis]MBB5158866.1 hypothetical protein [Saccharopolyspora phatthalungensis]